MTVRFPLLALLAGCTIEDADVLDSPAMTALDVSPTTNTLELRTTQITGSVTLGYTSDQLVAVTVYDNGVAVWAQTFEASALSIPIDATITLEPFENDVIVEAAYNGQVTQKELALTAPILDPAVTFPTFVNTYTPLVGMVTTGDLLVTAPAGYTVDDVAWSVDGGAWSAAVLLDTGDWNVNIIDPDIGTSRLDVMVTTSTGDYAHDTTFTSSFAVAPQFSCASTSMLPKNDMISNVGTEQRAMIGYFGRPDGGHFVQFRIDGNGGDNDAYMIVGRNTRVDPAAIETEFNVSRLTCNQNNGSNCTTTYTLTAYVDGAQFPVCPNFGSIIRY